MTDYEQRAGLWHATMLCFIAGFVDAIGYFNLGNVFTANMTGNTVLLGVSIVKGDAIALKYLATLAAFGVGVVISTLLKITAVPLPLQFVLAGATLVAIAFAQPDELISLIALSAVMGLQGGAIASFSGIRLPTVVVTSTLVGLVDGLIRRGAAALQKTQGSQPKDAAIPTPSSSTLVHQAAAWIAYGVGGAGAVLADAALVWPLLVPAVLYGIISAGLWWRG